MKNKIETFVILLFTLFLIGNSFAGVISNPKIVVSSNILHRVFFIKYKNNTGTAFTIDVANRQYLITAKHVVKDIPKNDIIEIFHDNQWKKIKVSSLHCGNEETDIMVLAPPFILSATLEIIPSSSCMYLSQDMYFLGYPYGLFQDDHGLNRDFPFPFVKKGTLSAFINKDGINQVIYLDGHNNPGFSGGPIVFQCLETDKLHVAGVVSSYKIHPDRVINKGIDTGLIAMSNSGIVKGYNIGPAIEAIKKNPIGPEIKTKE